MLVVVAMLLGGCASQYSQHTKADLTYTKDGRPIFSIDNDKSYTNLKIDVTKLADGSYEFHYAAEKTDANGAIEAVAKSNAKLAETLGGLAGAGAQVIAGPLK
jgi:major membrane immunogen (membrane-anchored lipoprotein)